MKNLDRKISNENCWLVLEILNYDINSDLERIKKIKFVYVENIINVSSVNNNLIN